MVNVLISNSEWRYYATQAIGWCPLIDFIPSFVKLNVGKRDMIVWLDFLNKKFSVKVASEQLRTWKQEIEWHDVVWFKNTIPRQLFFYSWLSNKTLQLRIKYIDLVFMVQTGALFVSKTMKITTTCFLIVYILKGYSAKFVADATFQEWGMPWMIGLNGLLLHRRVKLLETFLVN